MISGLRLLGFVTSRSFASSFASTTYSNLMRSSTLFAWKEMPIPEICFVPQTAIFDCAGSTLFATSLNVSSEEATTCSPALLRRTSRIKFLSVGTLPLVLFPSDEAGPHFPSLVSSRVLRGVCMFYYLLPSSEHPKVLCSFFNFLLTTVYQDLSCLCGFTP